MKFALALFKYFPHGGLQRDMLRMAEAAAARGHEVTVFTGSWHGAPPQADIKVCILPVHGLTNHGKARSFERSFLAALRAESFDAVTVFNRMAGGDLYFAADNCLADEWTKLHSRVALKMLPRYRVFLRQERAVCAPGSSTRILYITPRQKEQYQRAYHLPDHRFAYLPPGMNPACRRPENAEEIRRETRRKLQLADDDAMLILVGSDFRRKGGDRLIRSAAALPEAMRKKVQLFLVGNCTPAGCDQLAERLGIASQTHFTGGREDVPELLLAADLMVHPARSEATGTVLIEGIAAGVPVIATEACGFCNFISDIAPELALPEPFEQEKLNQVLQSALTDNESLKQRTRTYATHADFYRRAEVAVDLFEEAAKEKHARAN